MHISELDTPAVLIDIDRMEANLRRVADYAREHHFRLRPHTKTHKIPDLGRRQMELGAVGLTVAKTSEAEVMLRSGAPDLLVAYPVVGTKLHRLMQVAAQVNLTVALDSIEAAGQLSAAAQAAKRTVGVLAEIDAGLARTGVRAGGGLLPLAEAVSSLPGLEFRGIAFYPGHIKDMNKTADPALVALDDGVREASAELTRAGFEVSVVSGGSTPALFHSHRIRSMNEIRPGTYIFNDRNTWMCGGCRMEDIAASVLVTVVSTSVPDQFIVDGGSKTFSSDRCVMPDAHGFGYLPEAPAAVFTRLMEEHGFIEPRGSNLPRVGDRLRVIPNHICVAMNLHEQVYGVQGEEVVEVWRVEGRGKLQ